MLRIFSEQEIDMKEVLYLCLYMIIKCFDDKFISKVSEWNKSWVHVVIYKFLHNQVTRHLEIWFNTAILKCVHKVAWSLLRGGSFGLTLSGLSIILNRRELSCRVASHLLA